VAITVEVVVLGNGGRASATPAAPQQRCVAIAIPGSDVDDPTKAIVASPAVLAVASPVPSGRRAMCPSTGWISTI